VTMTRGWVIRLNLAIPDSEVCARLCTYIKPEPCQAIQPQSNIEAAELSLHIFDVIIVDKEITRVQYNFVQLVIIAIQATLISQHVLQIYYP